jgi:hypothetical protein
MRQSEGCTRRSRAGARVAAAAAFESKWRGESTD